MRDALYIIIPAYNEEENIEVVIKDWYKVVEKYDGNGKSRLVIINDGSKDATYKKALSLKKDYPLLEVIDKKNEGHGATVLYGYNYAIKCKADYIFQTDSDGQTLPSEFDAFWDIRKDYDMVIGDRKNREDGFSRVFVTKTLKAVLKFIFNVNVKDANTPFRLLNRETLEKYIGLIPDKFNLSNVILSVIYTKAKLRIKYMPITFRPRQGGINSIDFKKIVAIGKRALKDFKKINKSLASLLEDYK